MLFTKTKMKEQIASLQNANCTKAEYCIVLQSRWHPWSKLFSRQGLRRNDSIVVGLMRRGGGSQYKLPGPSISDGGLGPPGNPTRQVCCLALLPPPLLYFRTVLVGMLTGLTTQLPVCVYVQHLLWLHAGGDVRNSGWSAWRQRVQCWQSWSMTSKLREAVRVA